MVCRFAVPVRVRQSRCVDHLLTYLLRAAIPKYFTVYARPLLPLLAPCLAVSDVEATGRGGGADAARGRQQDAGYYGAACTSPNPAIPIPIRRR